jgi:hypothetical protein
MNVKRFTTNLKRQVEENPLAAIMIATTAATVVVKLISVSNEHRNSKAWSKEVDRRRRMS